MRIILGVGHNFKNSRWHACAYFEGSFFRMADRQLLLQKLLIESIFAPQPPAPPAFASAPPGPPPPSSSSSCFSCCRLLLIPILDDLVPSLLSPNAPRERSSNRSSYLTRSPHTILARLLAHTILALPPRSSYHTRSPRRHGRSPVRSSYA